MDNSTTEKIRAIKNNISGLGSALAAFSGGVDSTLVLRLAAEALPGRVVAVTLRSDLNPPGEITMAQAVALELGVEHRLVDFDPLLVDEVRHNRRDRCYHCKTALAALLCDQAKNMGLAAVIEGSHADDAQGYRPGARALAEAGIRSPLKEAGLTKAEIRRTAHELGLSNWDRPGQACLATRFPYDVLLDREKLNQVREAERLLNQNGFTGARARHHGDILRLELPEALIPRMLDRERRDFLMKALTALGFRFVTLDLAGYRSGVFDSPGQKG